jgi:hypothetical protein
MQLLCFNTHLKQSLFGLELFRPCSPKQRLLIPSQKNWSIHTEKGIPAIRQQEEACPTARGLTQAGAEDLD